ncbi:DUF433 domain-containing protein [Anatilimnocola floriformis]|uniref:DUF433 domain-containing protein n=1 Tax=Anatilimnocola floriformis TaxID=2948575 RepID=UPI0020C2B205|nr:DUF433 domain-containing protein [Anatilimnocola floriformis]
MPLLHRIAIDPDVCGGKPSVLHYSVDDLLHLLKLRTHAEVLSHYEDLWEEDLLAVEHFAQAIQYTSSTTLGEIAQQAAPSYEPEFVNVVRSQICRDIQSNGPQNPQLTTPYSQSRIKLPHYRKRRAEPLAPSTPVFGQYLTLSWLHHDGVYVLAEYVDRQEMADEIVSGGGITNGYVAWLAAFESGVLLPYQIRYTNLQGERKLLDKRQPEHAPEDWDWVTEPYRDVAIEWCAG